MSLKNVFRRDRLAAWQSRQRILRTARQVAAHEKSLPHGPAQAPVVVFNASTRLTGLSQNAAFSLLAAWGLRLSGAPVTHFVSHSGLHPCVLGTNRDDYGAPPPCAGCIAQSRRLYTAAPVSWFGFQQDPRLAADLQNLSIEELSRFEYTFQAPAAEVTLPLGELVLPSLRWALRRHTLLDAGATRFLYRQYMLSAASTAREFAALLERLQPAAALIFNGIMYPEAAARRTAQAYGVRVVTHEVGFQRFSAFFSEGDATAYPIHIPAGFELSPAQNARLDAYLESRFQGKFTMAGIQFWPEMQRLDENFLRKISEFRQVVPVFTNVVYDTSQVHANVHFEHMFAWLEAVLALIRRHPDTLFVIRAHPDEMRPGTRKQSRESVHDWVYTNRVNELPNVVFIDSQEYISSYELVGRSKFVIVYNSSIGLEAALMGAAVLCGGKARYTQYPIVYFPPSKEAYCQKAEELLRAEKIEVPPEFERNARRFLYYQLYRASLPLDRYLETAPRLGFVQLSSFGWQDLLPENSPSMRVIVDGILNGELFLLPEAAS
jgi:hypothetical protein